MGKIIAFALTTLLFLMATFLIVNPTENLAKAQTGSQVGGIITSDTTWSVAGSPYVFIDNVTVAKGTTLTITPGTVVDLQKLSFTIDGTLSAKGDDNNRIVLQAQKRTTYSWPPKIFFNISSSPWNETTGSGCIIDHALINIPTYQYSAIEGGSPKLSNNIFYNYGNDVAAFRIDNGLIVNNTIMGGKLGIVARNGSIIGNTIKDAEFGISCEASPTADPIYNVTLIGNLIFNNTVGISDWGSSLYVMNNSVINNQVGFRFTTRAFRMGWETKNINYNNLYGNSHAVLFEFTNTYPYNIINMVDNWWGTTDQSIIAKSIIDNRNLTTYSYDPVIFVPFLSQAVMQVDLNSQTTLPPESFPTITPSIVGPNTFSIESNSTVYALAFNGTTSDITFTVSGPEGSTGYVNATISKNFMPNGEAIQVYLDENPIDYSVSSNDASWIIYFSYHHSIHNVRINQAQAKPLATDNSGYLLYIGVCLVVAIAVFLSLIIYIKNLQAKL